MDTLTRRRFLVASGVAGGAALAAGAGAVTWSQLHQRATSDPLPSGAKILVIVTLYGGNDGLNTVIPYADNAYHDARPDLAYAESDVIHLDGSLALNPAMTGLAKLWSTKQLAIVRGVGYPKPDHSHFRSMDIWQTASPDEPVNTGWIGRWLDAGGDDPIRAVNIGSVLPPLAVGAKATAATLPLGRTKPLDPALTSALTGLGTSAPSDSPSEQMVCAAYRAERQVATTFAKVLDPNANDPNADPQSAAGSAGGQGSLKEQLDMVARCIKAGVPTAVYSVSLGGFDTHADEKGTQQTQLGVLDAAVSGFLTEMAADPRGAGVVLLAYSEFGRRVAANASQGTDHGTAGPVFVAGSSVKGGFYGSQPSLTDLDDGDLKSSTDFRLVYGELLAKVLGTDPARVLGSERPALGLIA
ncbi:MAG: DUF1501 domain-containing protein [Actinobacteria bacterium]|nr:DUF1501 domain-containing protein [Actinomycetota bacterium]